VLYRLKTAVTQGSANYPQWGLQWTYDRYGNRTAQTVTAGTAPANSLTVNPTTNRISGYCYDANGNLLAESAPPCPVPTYKYDAENRLVDFQGGGALYSYDGASLRVKKVSGGTTTVYVFSGSKVIAEYVNGAAPDSPTREYLYSGSQLLAKIEAGASQYYHQDHLSVRVITDTNGTKVGERGHFPFGDAQPWYETGTNTKWKFTTYERDAESLNDYAVARYHINRLGRFASPDPIAGSIADPQSLNRYSYVRNDPINMIDPLGLEGFCVETSWGIPKCFVMSTGAATGPTPNTPPSDNSSSVPDFITDVPPPMLLYFDPMGWAARLGPGDDTQSSLQSPTTQPGAKPACGPDGYRDATPQESAAILARAKTYVGVPYLSGGKDRTGVDCSGLVYCAIRESVNSSFQYSTTSSLPTSPGVRGPIGSTQSQPGDIVLFRGHVGFYDPNPTGRGQTILSARSGLGRVDHGKPEWYRGDPQYFRVRVPCGN